MTIKSGPGSRKRVVVILGGLDFSQKSAADIVRRVQAICREFQTTVLTASYPQCKVMFPSARIIGMPLAPFRAGAILFYVSCWLTLPFIRADLVYVADVISSPSVALFARAPTMCYGNSHPVQHAVTTRRKGGLLSNIVAALYGGILRHSLRRCDLILAISPQLKAVFESIGASSSKVLYLGVGVPIEMFSPSQLKTERGMGALWIGICHGTVSLDRGLGVMIEGTRILGQKRRDFRIRLVGCSEDEAELARQYAKKAFVEDLIDILPRVPYSKIPSYLWSSDWGISLLEPNAYFEASPPMKVLEFLAAGLPVIANRTSTHLLFLRDRINSLLISYDPVSFANAVQTMIEDTELRNAMARNALDGSSEYSESRCIRRLVRAANAVIEGNEVQSCLKEM